MLSTYYYELNDSFVHLLLEGVEICVKQHCCWYTHADAVTPFSWYQTDDRGFGFLDVSPTQPPIQWFMGAILPMLKRPWRKTDHSPPSMADFNPLNPELNPIYYLLALLGAQHFLHVSRIRVKLLTFRPLMSYIYGAPILDVSRSHTTTQHSR